MSELDGINQHEVDNLVDLKKITQSGTKEKKMGIRFDQENPSQEG